MLEVYIIVGKFNVLFFFVCPFFFACFLDFVDLNLHLLAIPLLFFPFLSREYSRAGAICIYILTFLDFCPICGLFEC